MLENINIEGSFLKILLLNYSDTGGGAAVAAVRLLAALRQRGVDADLGVVEKNTSQPSIICLKKDNLLKKILRRWRAYLLRFAFRTTNPILHSENKQTLLDIERINNSDYDLVHLHWVNYNALAIEDMAKIKKPLVWTLHDHWVFAGAEHYANIWENDERFMVGYTRANQPPTTKGLDICRWTWERKKKSWAKVKIDFIAPSNYEQNLFAQSALFKGGDNPSAVIPNIVPEDIFKPLAKFALRQKYGIPQDKKVIGFGALDISCEKSVKGGHLLLEALRKIPEPQDFHLVIFGRVDASFSRAVAMPLFSAGWVDKQNVLAELYNLCDVFVCPSVLENLPNVCLEALFCGVPVAAFATGGIPDIVEHRRTGYLARPFAAEDLAQGIAYCSAQAPRLSENSLLKAGQDFNNRAVLEKHISFYENVLKCRPGA
ncbi:glycosyl transferase group 1 [Candidatus Termititenax persephonae]|uniref:Glycosyl transferase group 1 n=1 Tax=Candidatus Termititenax persephonae TaxID=2218525 RepID=A0A388TEN6_9BACT|nr:glycosyl transferase group 1 [Candidatus Termititenax persephonae]